MKNVGIYIELVEYLFVRLREENDTLEWESKHLRGAYEPDAFRKQISP